MHDLFWPISVMQGLAVSPFLLTLPCFLDHRCKVKFHLRYWPNQKLLFDFEKSQMTLDVWLCSFCWFLFKRLGTHITKKTCKWLGLWKKCILPTLGRHPVSRLSFWTIFVLFQLIVSLMDCVVNCVVMRAPTMWIIFDG